MAARRPSLLMQIVVDNSVFMAHIFDDELSEYADKAMRLAASEGLIQPTIWWYEFRNVLLMGLRSNRINRQMFDSVLDRVSYMRVNLDFNHVADTTISYAQEFKLSFYDAPYLEVAYRRRIPLATLDKQLKSACQSLGVDTLG